MTETHPDISEAETITIGNAMLRRGISRTKIYKSIQYGRLQSLKAGGQRLIVISSMQRLLAPVTRKPIPRERADWRQCACEIALTD
jgi:hypothetical protein